MQSIIYERLYKKLKPVLTALGDDDYVKLESTGFMDLHINRLYSEDEGTLRISLAHNYIQNGDAMKDPDMEINIYADREMAEALTFEQDGFLALNQQVYWLDEQGRKMVNPKLKKQLNSFLNFWLGNIKKQGFFN